MALVQQEVTLVSSLRGEGSSLFRNPMSNANLHQTSKNCYIHETNAHDCKVYVNGFVQVTNDVNPNKQLCHTPALTDTTIITN